MEDELLQCSVVAAAAAAACVTGLEWCKWTQRPLQLLLSLCGHSCYGQDHYFKSISPLFSRFHSVSPSPPSRPLWTPSLLSVCLSLSGALHLANMAHHFRHSRLFLAPPDNDVRKRERGQQTLRDQCLICPTDLVEPAHFFFSSFHFLLASGCYQHTQITLTVGIRKQTAVCCVKVWCFVDTPSGVSASLP